MTDTSYRSSHLGTEKAASYHREYDESFLGYFWREVERPLVLDLLAEVHPDGLDQVEHLDVACGTGRILGPLSARTGRSTGIDISPDMAEFARSAAPNATVRVDDITALGDAERYDLVTAFRFFLNAEDQLRQDAISAIWDALVPGGILITNSHASPWSVIGLYRRLRDRVGKPADNTMAHGDFARFLTEAGFEIGPSRTYGYVPLSPRIGSRFMLPLCSADRALTGVLPDGAAPASNWLVAARKPL